MAKKRSWLEAMSKAIEKDMDCPVCLNTFFDPPIYLCENQHDLCETCRTVLKNQPQEESLYFNKMPTT